MTASTLFAFSMDPVADLPDRYGFGVTLLLTAVAFQFVVSTELPKLPYLTLLDEYIVLSFCFLFMVMLMMGIIPTFGDRYLHEPGELDTIGLADRYTLIASIGVLISYHIYIIIRIIWARKFEVPKIEMDQWTATNMGYIEESDEAINFDTKKNVRYHPEIWNKFLDKNEYPDVPKLDFKKKGE